MSERCSSRVPMEIMFLRAGFWLRRCQLPAGHPEWHEHQGAKETGQWMSRDGVASVSHEAAHATVMISLGLVSNIHCVTVSGPVVWWECFRWERTLGYRTMGHVHPKERIKDRRVLAMIAAAPGGDMSPSDRKKVERVAKGPAEVDEFIQRSAEILADNLPLYEAIRDALLARRTLTRKRLEKIIIGVNEGCEA